MYILYIDISLYIYIYIHMYIYIIYIKRDRGWMSGGGSINISVLTIEINVATFINYKQP